MATISTPDVCKSSMISFRISSSLSDPLFLDFMLVVRPPILTPVLVRERSKPIIFDTLKRLLYLYGSDFCCYSFISRGGFGKNG